MSILTINDFTGEVKIPLSTPNCGEAQKLESIIDQYENEMLIDLLGGMYGDFIVNQLDAKYQDLIEGSDFIIDGVAIPFIGLRKLMAYMIYYHYQHSESTQSSTIGEQRSVGIDNFPVLVGSKLSNAYNRFVTLTGTYTDSKYKPTLYNFLLNGDYTDWTICELDKTNSLGL